MTVWEYHLEGPEISLDRLNELGSRGWEAWGVDPAGAVRFKRPIETAAGLRSPRMALSAGPPPAQFDKCVAFVDTNGNPAWVTASNPLPTTA